MSIIKGKGQRLIPEELLKYLEALKNKYPDAVDLVEANPTLEGGEDTLSSVLINGTKYAVGGGGGSLFFHEVVISLSGNNKYSSIFLELYSSNSTPYTFDELFSEHVNNIPCTTTMSGNNSGYLGTRFATFQNEVFIGGVYINNGSLASDNERFSTSQIIRIDDTVTEV